MSISNWSSDVCSSDLTRTATHMKGARITLRSPSTSVNPWDPAAGGAWDLTAAFLEGFRPPVPSSVPLSLSAPMYTASASLFISEFGATIHNREELSVMRAKERSEEHTSELTSLLRISYAVF